MNSELFLIVRNNLIHMPSDSQCLYIRRPQNFNSRLIFFVGESG